MCNCCCVFFLIYFLLTGVCGWLCLGVCVYVDLVWCVCAFGYVCVCFCVSVGGCIVCVCIFFFVVHVGCLGVFGVWGRAYFCLSGGGVYGFFLHVCVGVVDSPMVFK